MTFHQRARMLKALAQYSTEAQGRALRAQPADRRDPARWLRSTSTAASARCSVFASKGRREMPDGQSIWTVICEQLSRKGGFLGQHVAVPLQGVAVHINAFNFPVWGMLEKAGAHPAGRHARHREARHRPAYLTEPAFRMMIDSGLLPDGAVQLVVGSTGDLLDRLGPQDVVSFTGSADTALHCAATRTCCATRCAFTPSRTASTPPSSGPTSRRTPRIRPFRQGGAREMTTKGGPEMHRDPPDHRASGAAGPRGRRADGRARHRIGDPALETTRMGALASRPRRRPTCWRKAFARSPVRCNRSSPATP
jgi:oxepin-CoA hydrolase/3-oxo-5,6-dehydrosuberyl-CoA semialdehyde dehydrogenase